MFSMGGDRVKDEELGQQHYFCWRASGNVKMWGICNLTKFGLVSWLRVSWLLKQKTKLWVLSIYLRMRSVNVSAGAENDICQGEIGFWLWFVGILSCLYLLKIQHNSFSYLWDLSERRCLHNQKPQMTDKCHGITSVNEYCSNIKKSIFGW